MDIGEPIRRLKVEPHETEAPQPYEPSEAPETDPTPDREGAPEREEELTPA